eukprot:Rmarinus@m.11193
MVIRRRKDHRLRGYTNEELLRRKARAHARWTILRCAVAWLWLRNFLQRQYHQIREDVRKRMMAEGIREEMDVGEMVPYWMQGSLEWYSVENLRRRKLLKRDPRVLGALHRWWESLEKTSAGGLGKSTYVKLNVTLQRMFIPQLDEAEVVDSALDDWESDMKGSSRGMSKSLFFRCFI